MKYRNFKAVLENEAIASFWRRGVSLYISEKVADGLLVGWTVTVGASLKITCPLYMNYCTIFTRKNFRTARGY